MNLLIYAVLGLAVTWALYMLYMQVATRASEGRSAQPLFALFPTLSDAPGPVLVYCFSPQCGPCRPMSKEVDNAAKAGVPVYKFDVTQHPAISRELGVRAIPTLILVENGAIARMLLGVRSAEFMQRLIVSPVR